MQGLLEHSLHWSTGAASGLKSNLPLDDSIVAHGRKPLCD
jgi:hypothetical protein